MKILIYDCEIIKAIPPRDRDKDPTLSYCDGWGDFSGMGISLIGAWWQGYARIFPQQAFGEFQAIADRADLIIGFNSKAFDDRLCAAHGIQIGTDYDLLQEVWAAAGLPRFYTPGRTRPGYKLDNLARANLGRGKSGSGELAPILWQRGRQWAVASYLTNDILITKGLWDKRNKLIDPINGNILNLKEPS